MAKEQSKTSSAESLFQRCDRCREIIYRKEIEKNLFICPKCIYHFRLPARKRITLTVDRGTFEEMKVPVESSDPLEFVDVVPYKERLAKARKELDIDEAIIVGTARIGGLDICLGVMDFAFMGGSMGVVVGERVARLFERGIEEAKPVVIFSASGGARMQEGIFALMQMAKTTVAVKRYRENCTMPYISVLTDPVTGGVSASFAMLGDFILAEPKALIGFAGPRVIETTINQKLPPEFQRSEFLFENGMIDMIVHRRDMSATIEKIVRIFSRK